MKASEIADALGLKTFNPGDDRAVTAGYCGDLLSRVMGRAPEGSAWITVMTNNNVAAVASLCDVACIILAEGAEPDAQLAARAAAEGICLFGSDSDTYSLAVRLSKLL